jgi:hypothetical protein
MPSLITEIVRRSDRAKGFVILPKRWIVGKRQPLTAAFCCGAAAWHALF